MKKFITGVLVGAVLATSFSVVAASGRMIEVFDNVKGIVVNDANAPFNETTRPFVHNATTYVPLRFVADALGQTVDWNSKEGIVYIGGNKGVEQNNNKDEAYSDIIGMWEGTYVNGTGEQGTTFKIYVNSAGELEANQKFYPTPNNLEGGTGEILHDVDYNPKTGVIQFDSKKAIELPSGWFTVDYRAVVYKNSISGHIYKSENRPIELKKVD